MQINHLSFFTIGYNPVEFQDFESLFVENLNQAKKLISKYDIDVLIIDCENLSLSEEIQFDLSTLENVKQKIMIFESNDQSIDIVRFHNRFQFNFIVFKADVNKFETFFLALQNAKNIRQNIQMEKLLTERSFKLKQIQNELELKIEKRSKYLKESRRKLFNTNYRVETYKNILFEIFNLNSIEDIENKLNKFLLNRLNLIWIKLIFDQNNEKISNEIYQELHYSKLEIPITEKDYEIGKIIFMRDLNIHFRKDEIDFLNRIAEAVSLAVHRIFLYQQSEKAHTQWMDTFQSIPAPFLIIDSNFNVVQSNLQKANLTKRKCYELIFNREEKCISCEIGKNFRLDKHEVYGQKLKLEPGSDLFFVHLYHNIEEKIKFEKRLFETARATEVGTIGSSIAHELNNPLAGMLTLTQVNLLELEQTHKFYLDFKRIEKSILKCKEIINNLLLFTRDQSSRPPSQFQLSDCINRTVNMCQLLHKRFKTNLIIKTIGDFNDVQIYGNLNLTAQAFKYIIEYFFEHMSKHQLIESNTEQEVIVRVSKDKITNQIKIKIYNEFIPIPLPKNHLFLSLTIAGKIFHDEGFILEWEKHSDHKLSANIYISRPI